MKLLELFSGTSTMTRTARKKGWTAIGIDNDPRLKPDICLDIGKITADDIRRITGIKKFDVIWASPPCTCFSVASIGHHWNKDGTPKTQAAHDALKLTKHTINLILELDPTYYFIENPRGMMRNIDNLRLHHRDTITYCQYGERRMKPTDIWHNCVNWNPHPPCSNGAPCHESAPRGSKTGTQGIKGAKDRGKLPDALCEEIIKTIENKMEN